MEYTITIGNIFQAESHEEAVAQMVTWLSDNAYSGVYRSTDAGGGSRVIDAQEISYGELGE